MNRLAETRTFDSQNQIQSSKLRGDMPEEPTFWPLYRNGAGSAALIAGIAEAVCAVVAFIENFKTVNTGMIAVICGWIGVNRVDAGTATNHRDALIGAALGGTALFEVFSDTPPAPCDFAESAVTAPSRQVDDPFRD